MVEEEDLDLAAVVCVDDAGAGIDEVLGCEAGAGGDAAICLLGENGTSQCLLFGCGEALSENRFKVMQAGGSEQGNLQVPAGTAMLMSVSTRALPRAGITVSLDAYKS